MPDRHEEFFRTAAFVRIQMGTFEELYRTHVQAVYRFALSVCGRKDVAEDLTSEAFLALHQNMASIDQALLPGWLLTVVRNRARDWWRRHIVEQRYAEQLAPREQTDPPSLERWILDDERLKPVHRTCLMLRYVYGMTRAEIAEKTGLSDTKVKGHLQYALTLLRQTYGVKQE